MTNFTVMECRLLTISIGNTTGRGFRGSLIIDFYWEGMNNMLKEDTLCYFVVSFFFP